MEYKTKLIWDIETTGNAGHLDPDLWKALEKLETKELLLLGKFILQIQLKTKV